MKKCMYCLFIIFALAPRAEAHPGSWKYFCEKYIVANDPHQYEDVSVDQLVAIYHTFRRDNYHSPALIKEIQRRLSGDLSRDDREILEKTIAGYLPPDPHQ